MGCRTPVRPVEGCVSCSPSMAWGEDGSLKTLVPQAGGCGVSEDPVSDVELESDPGYTGISACERKILVQDLVSSTAVRVFLSPSANLIRSNIGGKANCES